MLGDHVSLPSISHGYGSTRPQHTTYSNSRASTIQRRDKGLPSTTATDPNPENLSSPHTAAAWQGAGLTPRSGQQQSRQQSPRSTAKDAAGRSEASVFSRLTAPSATMQRALEKVAALRSSAIGGAAQGHEDDGGIKSPTKRETAESSSEGPFVNSGAFSPLPPTKPVKGQTSVAKHGFGSTAVGPFRNTFSGLLGGGSNASPSSGIAMGVGKGGIQDGNMFASAHRGGVPAPPSHPHVNNYLPTASAIAGNGHQRLFTPAIPPATNPSAASLPAMSRTVSTAPQGATRSKGGSTEDGLFSAINKPISHPTRPFGGAMQSVGPSAPIVTAEAPRVPTPQAVEGAELEAFSVPKQKHVRAGSGNNSVVRFQSGGGSRSSSVGVGGSSGLMNPGPAPPSPFAVPTSSPPATKTPRKRRNNSPQPPPPNSSGVVAPNKYFQNYHAMLIATKAENEAARLEAKGLARPGTLEGALLQEKAMWVRSNYAVLNKGVLPIINSLPTATVSVVNPSSQPSTALVSASPAAMPSPSAPRLSVAVPSPQGSPSEALTAQWEKSEVLVVTCNQMLVRHLQSLSDDHISLANALVALCERLLWLPHQLLLCNGPAVDFNATAPQLLAVGPLAGSDPFVGHTLLKQYLLGATLCNYAAVQRLSREPLEGIIQSLERALQLQELHYSCQTLFNLAAVLVEAQRFSEAFEAAALCIDLSNHYLSLPYLEREKQAPAYEVFITETASICVLTHHLLVAIGAWSGSLEVATYHAQLALGCSTTYLGTAHALTTRSAQRLEAVSQRTASAMDAAKKREAELLAMGITSKLPTPYIIEGKASGKLVAGSEIATGPDELTPPLIPLYMSVFGSSVRPSAVLAYASCYPLSSHLQRRLAELKGSTIGPDGAFAERAMRRGSLFKGIKSAKVAFSKHFTNVMMERQTGLPAISTSSIAGSPTPAYLAMVRAHQHAMQMGDGKTSSGGGLRLIPPAAPGTVLMPPLTPKYRSVAAFDSPTRQYREGGGGGGLTRNRFLVAQMDKSLMATPVATRAPTPLTSSLQQSPPPLRLMSIGDASSSQLLSPSLNTNAGVNVSTPLLDVTPTPRFQSIRDPPATTASLSPPNTLHRRSGGSVGGSPSSRGRSPSAFAGGGGGSVTIANGGTLIAADDGSLLPGFTLEKPRGSIILSDRHILVPQPPAPRTAKCVSVVPLRDYELYQALQSRVEGFLAPSPPRQQQQQQRWHRGSIVGTNAPRSHSFALLKRSDAELRELSEVVPDHTGDDEERWHAAARMLQLFYKIIAAKHERMRRQYAVAQWREYAIRGETISNAFQAFKERRPCVEEKHRRMRHRDRVLASTLVQSILRGWLSMEVAAGKVLAVREEERIVAVQTRLERMGAVVIQSLWRGHAARKGLARQHKAARTLQRWMRLHEAYQHVRLLVFKKRKRAREVKAYYDRHASTVQRWWRHQLLAIVARRELRRRQEALSAFMADYLEKDKAYWAQFKDVNEEQCTLVIGRVGRAFVERRRFGQWAARFYKESKACRIIQRFVRYGIAKGIRNIRREEKAALHASKRRDEERRVAAIDIQSVVRMFLAKQLMRRIKAHIALRLRSALIIQRLDRRVHQRKILRSLLDAKAWDKMLYQRAETRRHAAAKIQSVWRMHRARQFTAQYRHFKCVVEPAMANVVQSAVRCFLARCRYRDRLVAVESMLRVAQRKELERCSAIKIQSVWRMFKVTSHPTYGRTTHPSFVASKAATRIQALWRRVAAKGYVAQQRLIAQHRNHCYTTQESLHAYATRIQKIVRGRLSNAKFMTAARHAKDVWAVRKMQACGRRFMRRRAEHRLAMLQASEAWKVGDNGGIIASEQQQRGGASSSPLIRKDKSSLITSAASLPLLLSSQEARDAYVRKVLAGLRIVRWAKVCLAKHELRRRQRAWYQMLSDTVAKEREDAAKVLQRWWRRVLEKKKRS